jgi:hypothetical protein
MPVRTRPEVIVATLLYLVTAYRTSRCPALASCIERHFDCLARHPQADRIIRDIATALTGEWAAAAHEVLHQGNCAASRAPVAAGLRRAAPAGECALSAHAALVSSNLRLKSGRFR